MVQCLIQKETESEAFHVHLFKGDNKEPEFLKLQVQLDHGVIIVQPIW